MPSKRKAKVVHTKLYEILGVDPKESQKGITKAFRLRAIKVHPDKRPDDPNAKEDFQALQSAYDILKDPKRRSLYDETGAEDDIDSFTQAADRYSSLFRNVTEEDIESFAARYKGSEEEKEDVADFYRRFDGNVTKLLDFVPLSEPDEVERFIDIMETLIEEKVLDSKRQFKTSCEKLRKEAKKYKKKLEKEGKEIDAEKRREDSEALVEAVKANQKRRQQQSSSFLESLEAKFTKPAKKKQKLNPKSDKQ